MATKLPATGSLLFATLLTLGPGALCSAAPAARGADKGPLGSVHAYVCGLHFYNGRMARQVVAHHYCAHGSGEMMQCVIYDSNRKDARLIGIEYVVSARVYGTLSAEEKKLWHSHAYEVKSGLLVAPGLSGPAERSMMKNFATSYGKTWHTWQVDRGDRLPLGIPQLMMAFTADGQVDPGVLAQRDQDLGVSTPAKRRERAGFSDPLVDPGADSWTTGAPLQLELLPQGKPELEQIPMH